MKNILFCLFLGIANITFAWGLSTGTYELSGKTADGSPYSGEVVIKRQGQNYRLEWMTGGHSTQVGIGIFDSWESVLSVAFTDVSNPRAWGVATYKVDIFGDLEGKWTTNDSFSQGSDKLKWKSSYTY